MTNSISPGALRAETKLRAHLAKNLHLLLAGKGEEAYPAGSLAAIIDESTGLPELLEALKQLRDSIGGPLEDVWMARATKLLAKSEGTI